MLTVVQLLYSIKTRDQRRDITGDPWDGRTLEWLTLSPPPHYNFAVLPDVHGEEAYWTRKQTAIKEEQLIDEPDYQPIEMPVNTPTGVIVAFFASRLRLRHHLVHLVACDPRPDRRLRDLRLVRVARRA